MTLKEFFSNLFGAVLFVLIVWGYTVVFTLVFAPE